MKCVGAFKRQGEMINKIQYLRGVSAGELSDNDKLNIQGYISYKFI
jgi:hypothetical protein